MTLCFYQIMVLILVAGSASYRPAQEEKIYTVSEVSIKPHPPKGIEHFKNAWSKRVKYPELAIQKNIQGMVFIEFMIDEKGFIHDASVKSGLGYGCDEEALKGFREVTEEAWQPGIKNGKPVKVKMVFPFFFRITKR